MRTTLQIMVLVLIPLGGCGEEEADNSLFLACVRRHACGVKAYPRISNCVENYTTRAYAYGWGPAEDVALTCAASAKTCDQVKACYGAGSSCDITFKATCTGGKARYCDTLDAVTYSYDCAAVGLSCAIDKGGAFVANCEGSKTSPVLPTDLTCAGDWCSETGESCDGNAYDSCSGGKLKACLNKAWVLFDCKSLGLGDCYTSSSNGTSSCGLPL